MKTLVSLSIIFMMIATCNAVSNAYGSLSMSLRNQLSHVRRLEREEDKILNDILYMDEMQQSKMPSPRLDKVDRASLGLDKKDPDTNPILQKPKPKTGTYDCESVASDHPVIMAWKKVMTGSENDESCDLKNIRDATFSTAKGCTGVRITQDIALTATHCFMGENQGICDNADADYQVIRHLGYYRRDDNRAFKHDIGVFYKTYGTASNFKQLNCLQHDCSEATSCKIISKDGIVNVSLAFCTAEEYRDGSVSRTNPNSCHTMCVRRKSSESLLKGLSGSPVICNDVNKGDGNKWYIRGIMSFKKPTRHDYAMVAMIDKSTIDDTTCDCRVSPK